MRTSQLVASFAHKELAVSLLLPEDWSAEGLGVDGVRFHGPEDHELDDYHPTFSITAGQADGFGDAWFDEFTAQARRQREQSYEGFRPRAHERYMLSSLVPVDATWYEWDAGPGLRTAQLQALIPGGMRLYVINGATRIERADIDLPVFDAILRSLRLL
ncbi:MAG: hypothetical protein JJU06_11540 [Ectothiorhodospiraceae bacterium]|nr:hypothetical protein [Ectothiorhodospiraceae bacterium]MCH8503392.1 hypothetical protein [Ectothiorhodospiraceae bacterium]